MSNPETGGSTTSIRMEDRRMTSFINWVWAALGAVGVTIGLGVYNKLSNMNDTLILAVSKLETQGSQISDLRMDVARQRDEMSALRAQVSMIEGKTLRGIQDATRGH